MPLLYQTTGPDFYSVSTDFRNLMVLSHEYVRSNFKLGHVFSLIPLDINYLEHVFAPQTAFFMITDEAPQNLAMKFSVYHFIKDFFQRYSSPFPFLGLYSLSGKTSYRQISWSLEAARLDVAMVVSLWNLTGTSAAALPRYLPNFRAIGKV